MSTTAFGLGSKYFALYEVAGVGIQWRTISQSPVEGDDFNLGLSMMMLIIDAAVYGVLTWYIEAVHPGEFLQSCQLPEATSHIWGDGGRAFLGQTSLLFMVAIFATTHEAGCCWPVTYQMS